MKHVFLSLIIWFSLSSNAQTQKGRISGNITDKDGLPAGFVSVLVTGTSLGTTSDEYGNFIILNVPTGPQTLSISAVGFEEIIHPLNVEANVNTQITLTLSQSTKQLAEVEVLGQKQRTASATKLNTELIDIPMSIQVLNQEIIQQQNAFDMATLTRNISNVTMTSTYAGESSYQFFNARGFDLNNWQNYRRNGMMIWNMGAHFNDNIESVEFLKGPTAILYGDVAPGGVMNLVTKKPLPYDYKRLEMKVGQYGLLRPSLDLSGPMNENKTLLYRVNASYQKSNSFRDQVESEALMFTPAITWKITPKLEWTVEYILKETEATNDPGLTPVEGKFENLSQLPYDLFLGESRMKYQYTDNSIYSSITYHINNEWLVRSNANYGYITRTPYAITPGGPPDAAGNIERYEYNYNQWFDTRTISVDLVGSVVTGGTKHNLLLGADYFDSYSRFTESAGYNLVDVFNIFNPIYKQAKVSFDNSPYSNFRFFYKRKGFYFQDQISMLNDRLQVLLGLRQNITEQGNVYDRAADRPEGDDIARVTPLSPRAGIVYKPLPWMSVFGSYTKSYEVNTADIFATNYADYPAPDPTEATQVEFGVKANLFQERLGTTLTAFNINKTNIFGWVYENPTDPGAADFRYFLYQGGEHRSRGVELDLNGKVTEQLSVTASAFFTNATIVEDPAYPAGNRLGGTPRTGFSVWGHYTFNKFIKGLSIGGGAFNRGLFYGSNNNIAKTDGYTTFDASIGYTFKGFTTQLNITNLTDKKYYLQYFSDFVWEPQWRRRAVLSIAYKF